MKLCDVPWVFVKRHAQFVEERARPPALVTKPHHSPALPAVSATATASQGRGRDGRVRWGIDDDDAVHLVRVMRSALHGFVSLETGGGFGLPLDLDHSFDLLVDSLVAAIEAQAVKAS